MSKEGSAMDAIQGRHRIRKTFVLMISGVSLRVQNFQTRDMQLESAFMQAFMNGICRPTETQKGTGKQCDSYSNVHVLLFLINY
jgi:hypothetical protein